MATNQYKDNVDAVNLAVGSGTLSGDPINVGAALVGIALTDRDSDGKSVVMFGRSKKIVTVSVKGVNGSGNSAVALGDALFFVSGDTPPISKKATGIPFGIALEAVSSGATDTTTKVLMDC